MVVLALCSQCSCPSTRKPLSSQWTTSACRKLAVNLGQRRFTASCHRLIGLSHKGPGRRMTIEVTQHFTGAGNRNEVVVVQIAGLCLEAHAILDWLAYTWRKCRLDAPLALAAILDLGSMFGHFDLDRWHIVYLAADIVARLPHSTSRSHSEGNGTSCGFQGGRDLLSSPACGLDDLSVHQACALLTGADCVSWAWPVHHCLVVCCCCGSASLPGLPAS